MLALLGWNPGTTQEIFTLDELVEAFSLDRVSKAGAKFDPEKTKWFQQQYLRAQSDEEIALKLQEISENELLWKQENVDLKDNLNSTAELRSVGVTADGMSSDINSLSNSEPLPDEAAGTAPAAGAESAPPPV
jgi:glutamyl/glutaminyl-tRNA synthetase